MDKQLFAKIKNGELEIAPHNYQDEINFIMNFDECEELMLQYGYKPIIGEEPKIDRLTQSIHVDYIEEENYIRRICTIYDKMIPQSEEVNSIDKEVPITREIINDINIDNLLEENKELRGRIEILEKKQQEMFNILNSFINETVHSLNKVNDLDSSMSSIKNSIRTFNQFIDFYNDSKRK